MPDRDTLRLPVKNMVLTLILIFILLLVLAVIIASAAFTPSEGSNKTGSDRELSSRPHNRKIASQLPASTAIERATTDTQTRSELAQAQVNYFRAAGRTNFEATDEIATGFEDVFASRNKPFKGGGRNSGGDDQFCFLTGQRQAVCQCADHINRRARG